MTVEEFVFIPGPFYKMPGQALLSPYFGCSSWFYLGKMWLHCLDWYIFSASWCDIEKGLSAFVWRQWNIVSCGWQENGQGYHLAICRNDSLNQDIFKDTKNNEIQIHYLRQLMFEKCITHVQVGLCPGLNNGQPTSQTIHPYVDQSMTTIAYCRPLGAQRVML